MQILRFTLMALALAFAAPARSLQYTVYLPANEGPIAKGVALEEAPSDADPPVHWRRGVGGTETTDQGESSPQ